MERFNEKNLGIPAVVMSSIAYFIAYLFTSSFAYGILTGLVFAFIVYGFSFDDRVKRAFQQGMIIAVIINLVDVGLELLEKLIKMIAPSGFSVGSVYSYKVSDLAEEYDLNFFHNILLYILKYSTEIFNILIPVVFFALILQTLRNKDINIRFINKIVGSKAAASGISCSKCGKSNVGGAAFCESCGNKLN